MAEKIGELTRRSRRGLLKVWSALLSTILALPFLASCDNKPMMYGVLQAKFAIKGTVSSSLDAAQVIEGIEVDLKNSNETSIKSLTTAKDGSYIIELYERDIPSLPVTVKITFKDIDGEQNGLFQNSEQILTITEEEIELNKGIKKVDANLDPLNQG